jgi:hypothetical protein
MAQDGQCCADTDRRGEGEGEGVNVAGMRSAHCVRLACNGVGDFIFIYLCIALRYI